jgi:hypothetical protein
MANFGVLLTVLHANRTGREQCHHEAIAGSKCGAKRQAMDVSLGFAFWMRFVIWLLKVAKVEADKENAE